MVTVRIQGRRQTGPSLWGRLLWKEWREDWLPLAIGVGLPLLSRPLWDQYGGSPFLSAYFLVICLTLLWAIYRTQTAITGAGARTILPVPGFPHWLFTIPVPIMAPAITGVVLGVLVGTWPAFQEMTASGMMPAFALYLMAGYALCAVAASAFTAFPAVLIGGGWMILTNPFRPEDLPQQSVLFALVIVGALLAQGAWEACSARRWFLPGRIGIAVALAWLALFPLGMAQMFHRGDAGGQWRFSPSPLRSSLHQASVTFSMAGKTSPPSSLEYLHNMSSGSHNVSFVQEHQFGQFFQPLGFRDATHVLVGQQQPGESVLHIIEWDVTADTVHEVITFTPGRYALYHWHSEVSPDGRYLLFLTNSSPSSLMRKIPLGYDLWVVDLVEPRAGIAAVGMMTRSFHDGPYDPGIDPSIAQWETGRCYLLEEDPIVEIDLTTLRSRRMDQ